MKKFYFVLPLFASISFIAIVSSSCSDKEDDNKINTIEKEDDKDTTEIENPITTYRIIGRWQLQQVDLGFGGTRNCSEKNIEYLFLSTGKLKVSDDSEEDGRGIFLTRGEHQYALNEKKSQITIDSSTYQYQIKDKELIINTGSAWDAPVYIFNLINQ